MKFTNLSLSVIGLKGAAAATLRGDSQRDLAVLYYPRYTGDYATGWCTTHNNYAQGSPGYATELACCQAAFSSQTSGKCLSMLPSPPTVSPTGVDGPDAWYSNGAEWSVGKCINTAPVPNGRIVYDTQLECCKGVYSTQESGYCFTQLPSPPTVSPTGADGPDAWYSNNANWEVGECINTAPVPNGRTVYDTQLECCKGVYATQESGYCFTKLPSPPTVSPTGADGPDAWYADFELDWADGKCINTAPVPNGRIVYDTQLECCKGAYGSQESGACIADLPTPPTVSPTGHDGPDAWYSNNADWSIGECINTAPVPNGRTVYDTQLECCKGAYATQESGYCLTQLPNPPTVSPTGVDGPDAWYANFDLDWADGVCINTAPVPIGRIVYDTQLECCKGAYGSQESGACVANLPTPPTVSPTGVDGPDAWYSNNADWSIGECINTAPVPSGRTVYDTQLECCKGAYGTQESGYCLTQLPNPPTVSPTGVDGPDAWYSNNADWSVGKCINTAPVPSGRTVYDTQLECCKGAYASQESGYCLTQLPDPPTVSPTGHDGPDAWYSNNEEWSVGKCINTAPVPSGRVVYDTQLECCKGAYATQESGACLADLPSPPTSAPVGADAPFFPIWSGWSTGHCDNDPTKRTSGNSYNYESQAACCEAWFSNQASGACMNFDPTYGSRSPTAAPIQ